MTHEDLAISDTVRRVANILSSLGLRIFIIGARGIMIHGVDLGRETRDWDLAIDRYPTLELRDKITETLRSSSYKVQWRKWGFLVEDDIHIDINYAPLTLDEEFIARSTELERGILLPSLEDMVVMKLMSGERKDLDDLKKILSSKWQELDKHYLYRRAKQAGLERELEKLVRRLRLT
ncbi:MAG TPA: DUF6036 family nucleotidyltransferase [Sulfolobales archaeon]|nr:DUF6036 family nucleotidyltransferase [Sulfolobales archaeon]